MADYGHQHRRLRKKWAAEMQHRLIICARCPNPIHPGEPWDLGHLDDNSGEYQGPEHRACNRKAGGYKRWHPTPTPEALGRWVL